MRIQALALGRHMGILPNFHVSAMEAGAEMESKGLTPFFHRFATRTPKGYLLWWKMPKSPADKEVYVLALEWSESPYHQGVYRIFLRYSAKSRRWALLSRPNPSRSKLASQTGDGSEEPRKIALDLLKKSFADGRLQFDAISDAGPFDIQKKEFVPPRRVLVPTGKPICPPRKTCEFCRHLRWPEGFAAAMARIFDCDLGKWTDKERGIDPNNPSGVRKPNLNYSCSQFVPREETVDVGV